MTGTYAIGERVYVFALRRAGRVVAVLPALGGPSNYAVELDGSLDEFSGTVGVMWQSMISLDIIRDRPSCAFVPEWGWP